ncbi:hypothetical protein OsI_38103 [Oryza sativa Indica Group]|nr:hypothetical protein OsI_38103 [Oryza sativa Indica Group]
MGVFSLVDSREAAEAPTASHGDGLESQCGGSHAAVQGEHNLEPWAEACVCSIAF